ncbi:MAG: c-type cytochrome biogenesis protein CcmI, partial [Roseovarius sp.]|nr:c-type cytochrome biogenesis protein CcmI [Roseovarius sp.]
RRILAADAHLRTGGEDGGQPRIAGWLAAGATMVIIAGGGVLLYDRIGAPGYGDLPIAKRIAASDAARAERLSQDEAEARFGQQDQSVPEGTSEDYIALIEQLRKTVKERPDDQQGLQYLVRSEAALGNMAAARRAQQQLIALKGETASAADHAMLADLMINASAGYVSAEAEAALREALRLDPREPSARFYLGLYLLQVDRPDGAFRTWQALLEESTPDAPWVAPIRAQIEDLAARAGVKYTLPPADGLRGPTSEDVDNAAGMSAEGRQDMIRGMVAGLAERLSTTGGSAEEWARLINAYGVLGEQDEARQVWSEAQVVFAANPAMLDTLRAAAANAGISE